MENLNVKGILSIKLCHVACILISCKFNFTSGFDTNNFLVICSKTKNNSHINLDINHGIYPTCSSLPLRKTYDILLGLKMESFFWFSSQVVANKLSICLFKLKATTREKIEEKFQTFSSPDLKESRTGDKNTRENRTEVFL